MPQVTKHAQVLRVLSPVSVLVQTTEPEPPASHHGEKRAECVSLSCWYKASVGNQTVAVPPRGTPRKLNRTSTAFKLNCNGSRRSRNPQS